MKPVKPLKSIEEIPQFDDETAFGREFVTRLIEIFFEDDD